MRFGQVSYYVQLEVTIESFVTLDLMTTTWIYLLSQWTFQQTEM